MNEIGLNSKRIINFKSAQEAQNQQIPQMSVEQSLPDVPLPSLYNIPEAPEQQELVDRIKKIDLFGIVYPWLEHPLTMVGTCAAMAYGVDKFSQACGGEYSTSLVGKAANLGDKIEQSKFVQSKPFQKVWGWGETAKGKVKHFFRNSDLLNSIFKTPSQPEWPMVKDEMLSMRQRVVHTFSEISRGLKWTEEGFTKLENLGLDKDDKKFLKEIFGDTKLSTVEEKASNAVRLKRIGMSKDAITGLINSSGATEMVKAKELEQIGLSADYIKKLEKNPPSLKDVITIEKACDKGRNIRIGAGHQPFLGPFQPFERKIGLSEVSNRLKSMLKGAKTKTGRFFASVLQKCHRGFTFGGGKMNAIFFVSPLLVETMMDVKKAEPNEKLGTAAHGAIHAVSWVFTFPLALKVMHHIGGMQYAGMNKDDVAKYRKLIKDFNEEANPFKEKSWMNVFGIGEKKAADKTFQSYDAYKKKLDSLNAQLKALRNKNTKNQNLITKVGKQLAKFLTIDLETISSYKNGSAIGNFARKIPNFFKNFGGVPMRFALWGAITMGIFDTLINKGIKGCFGNFYDRFKEEEFVNAKKEQKKFFKQDLKTRLYEKNQQKVLGLEKSASAGDFSKENLAMLTPSINTQNQKKETVTENQSLNQIQNNQEQKLENFALEKENNNNLQPEIPLANTKESNIEQEKAPETALSKALNSESNEVYKDVKTNPVKEDRYINNGNQSPIEQEKDNYTYVPNTSPVVKEKEIKSKRDNYTYIPSSDNVLKKNQNFKNTKKYIPSQQGVKFNKTFDNSGLAGALRRADRAEQLALQTLAGNFNSY